MLGTTGAIWVKRCGAPHIVADPLDLLRDELRDVDRQLLELVKTRQELSSQIGELKRASGLPTRDYGQERVVLERSRTAARALGLREQIGEELMLLLIRSSLTVQERDRIASGGTGTGKRIAVIGGAGQMGQWFVRFLGSQGFEIDVVDPGAGDAGVADWRELTLDHDIVVIATPLQISNQILLEMAKSPPPGIVFDIGSLKSPLRSGLAAMAKAGANITSVHPMFGPVTELLSGRHVIFVDVGVPEATAAAKQLFAPTMAAQVEMDLEDHDRLIAYVLGLSHALNLAFATALAESGEAAPRLSQLSSTTFDAQLAVAKSVANESADLYFEIQSLNDYGTEALSGLLYAVERLRSVVRAGDHAGFATLMKRCRGYLSDRPSGDQAPP